MGPTSHQGPLMAELRTKHASNLATDWFCFPLITGTRGIQGDHFRDRPIAAPFAQDQPMETQEIRVLERDWHDKAHPVDPASSMQLTNLV